MRKTFRKKTLRKKYVKRNEKRRKRTYKNRKMRGGFEIVTKDVLGYPGRTYDTVIFSEEDKINIKAYLAANPKATSIEIRDKLFPQMKEMSEQIQSIAEYQIQVVLGRAYAGR